MQLRSVDKGTIVGKTVTDRNGVFSFAVTEPGLYVVEAVSNDGGIAAVGNPVTLLSLPVTTNVVLQAPRQAHTAWVILAVAGGAALSLGSSARGRHDEPGTVGRRLAMDGSSGPSDERAGTRRLGTHRTDPPRRVAIDHGAHFLDRLNVIYKYRYAAVSLFLLIVLLSLLRTYTTTPLYRAQARLMIEMEDERTAVMAGAISTASPSYWQDPKSLLRNAVPRAHRNGAGSSCRQTSWSRAGSPSSTAPLATPRLRRRASESALIAQLLAQVSVAPVQNSRLVDVVVRLGGRRRSPLAPPTRWPTSTCSRTWSCAGRTWSRAWSGSRRSW